MQDLARTFFPQPTVSDEWGSLLGCHAKFLAGRRQPHAITRRSHPETKWFARSAAPEISNLVHPIYLILSDLSHMISISQFNTLTKAIHRVPEFQNKMLWMLIGIQPSK